MTSISKNILFLVVLLIRAARASEFIDKQIVEEKIEISDKKPLEVVLGTSTSLENPSNGIRLSFEYLARKSYYGDLGSQKGEKKKKKNTIVSRASLTTRSSNSSNSPLKPSMDNYDTSDGISTPSSVKSSASSCISDYSASKSLSNAPREKKSVDIDIVDDSDRERIKRRRKNISFLQK